MRLVDPRLVVLAFACVAYLAMLFPMLRVRGTRAASPALLAAFLLSLLGWSALQLLSRLQVLNIIAGFDLFALQRIQVYLLLANGVFFYQLTRRFQHRTGPGLAGWVTGALFLAAAVLLYENPLRLADIFFVYNGYALVRGLLAFSILVVGWGVFMVSAVLLTIRGYRLASAPLHRNRSKYWSLAAILLAPGTGLALARLGTPAALLHLLAAGVTVYSLLTYHLPDLRLARRRISSYLIMTLLTVAVYTGSFTLIQRVFQTTPGYSPVLAGAILAVVLATLFNPLLSIVQRFVSQLISGPRYDSGQTLSEYSISISNILDIEVLATVVVGLISDTLEISHGALVIVHYEPEDASAEEVNDAGSYHLRSISGQGEEMPAGRLYASNPVVYSLWREHHPLTQYDIDLLPRFKDMESAERAWLSSLNMDVYVPIYTKENWIGMLALGRKASGDRYFDEDLRFLQTLADQTAVALENARLYDDLKQRNAENERLNSDLKSANEELARLDRAKSDFIHIASHELRTPLTQVIGFNDILGDMIKADEMETAVGVQMTDSVRRAARRLEDIVETMFDVSKLDTKTLDLLRAPVALSAVLSVAVETWARGMKERKLTISVRGLADLPPITADRKRLTQVFSQLIQNAIKSTPDGGQIRVSGRLMEDAGRPARQAGGYGESGYEQAEPDQRFVEVVVSDSGIGIAREDLERVFERFYRVGDVLLHSSGETKFKGAGPGLGLTIARGIVEAHGGRLWAESPGHDEETCPGADFHVVLPVREDPLELGEEA